MKKRVVKSLFILVFSILFISFAVATFSLNGAGVVSQNYAPRSNLMGELNLTLVDEPHSSLLVAEFNGAQASEITLLDWLENTGVDYECSVNNCGSGYDAINPSASKSLILNNEEEALVGFLITSSNNIQQITNATIRISSSAPQSCINPLNLDILEDGMINWKANDVSSSVCNPADYGCYQSSSKEGEQKIDLREFCQNIDFSGEYAGIKLGANINGSGNAGFLFRVYYDNGEEKSCIANVATGATNANCVVNLSRSQDETLTVCVSAQLGSQDKYSLSYEDTSPCGYLEDSSQKHDFSIYAETLRFSQITNKVINHNELLKESLEELNNYDLIDYIEDYLDDTYSGDCSNGCVIPIKISSNLAQTITIDGAALKYLDAGIEKTASQLYDLTAGTSLISMNVSLVDLNDAGLKVPGEYGAYDLILSLGGEKILEDSIDVLKIPFVSVVYPQKVPASIETKFIGYTSEGNFTKYIWNFGDDTEEVIAYSNFTSHKYNQTGIYELSVEVQSDLGNITSTFKILVQSPEEYIENILDEMVENIANLRTKLGTYPAWVNAYLDKQLDLDKKEEQIQALRVKFNGAGGDTEEYIQILNDLENLEVPSNIKKGKGDEVQHILDTKLINLKDLSLLGAGDYDSSYEASYKDGIFQWFVESMTVLVDKETYVITVKDKDSVIASSLAFNIDVKKELDDVYMMIVKPLAELGFSDSGLDKKAIGSSTGITFGILNDRTIDLMILGEVDLFETPIYLAPRFSQVENRLGGATQVGICNNNGLCQSDRGENSSNCRSDCKPWGWVLLWLFILFLIGFAIYILLQEWYKRHYEDQLFKNKNDLFNLINFMDNAEKQGLKKEQIFTKLKAKGWNEEQLTYAWKKYKGQRTGMWEIPVFTLIQKAQAMKKVKEMRAQGQTGQIAPIAGAKQPATKIVTQGLSNVPPKPPIGLSKPMNNKPTNSVMRPMPSKPGPQLPMFKKQNINKPNSSPKDNKNRSK